jgi:hypothetical protein
MWLFAVTYGVRSELFQGHCADVRRTPEDANLWPRRLRHADQVAGSLSS